MFIIPAIDLKGGRCVRLVQGEAEQETDYPVRPQEALQQFIEAGATRIHLVDLDGAFQGERRNATIIADLIATAGIPVEVGGGIRQLTDIAATVAWGADRVIIGTAATQNPQLVADACSRYPGKIAVGIDVRDGYVAVRGWTEKSRFTVEEFVPLMEEAGVDLFIFTDVSRDGTLSGPNLAAIDHFISVSHSPMIASGGIGNLEHVRELMTRQKDGVIGVIAGKALYDGRILLEELV